MDPAEIATLDRHIELYRAAAEGQKDIAVLSLQTSPPDYSSAATACHRALQFTRQAEALRAYREAVTA